MELGAGRDLSPVGTGDVGVSVGWGTPLPPPGCNHAHLHHFRLALLHAGLAQPAFNPLGVKAHHLRLAAGLVPQCQALGMPAALPRAIP